MRSVTLMLALAAAGAAQAAETWAFEPATDSFDASALLDLSHLNEDVAGESGWIRISKDGGFETGSGEEIRFWAVNTGVERRPHRDKPHHRHVPPDDIGYHAKWLAKRGVNMVRCHSHINPDPKTQALTDVNMGECEWIWKTVGTMAQEGIYTTVSPYWANTMKSDDAKWGTDWEGRHHGLLFFDPKLQDAYKAWLKTLLTTPSEHLGGKTLAEHPGMAIFQIQNEDSMLFWTVGSIKGGKATMLGKRFGDWVIAEYGSIDEALAAWNGVAAPGDNPAAGVLGMLSVWDATRDGRTQKKNAHPRIRDQLRFWTELMHDFNAEIERYLEEDLGCPVIVNAGNWKTADTVLLNDLERYSYDANEVIAVNRYFSGIHNGEHRGWAIINGDQYTTKTALGDGALDFPLNLKQVAGKPMMITESTWVFPEENAFEAPLMIAAYSSLTGFDAYYWFSTGTNDWTHPQSANGYLPSQTKWLCMTPDLAGQWLGAAFAFRSGLIAQGEPVVTEHRSLAAMYEGKTPIIAETASFDPNRDAGDLPANSAVTTGVSPWAFLAGPVEVVYASDEAKTEVATDLDELIQPSGDGMKVTSITGELELDTGAQRFTVDAPRCQAVAGHFEAPTTIELGDVTFTTGVGSMALMAVPLDGKDLKRSKQVLIQVGTQCRPTGWQTKPVTITPKGGQPVAGKEITSYGQRPWAVESSGASVAIANRGLKQAVVLDMNGMSRATVALSGSSFQLPADAMYVVLTD